MYILVPLERPFDYLSDSTNNPHFGGAGHICSRIFLKIWVCLDVGYEYKRTLDKPVASLSCAILGSQHNIGTWGGNSVKFSSIIGAYKLGTVTNEDTH